MIDSQFLKVAKQAALEAGKIISRYSGKTHEHILKEGDRSNFATRADLEAEEKIVEILTKNFPDHNIIAEEKTRINKNSRFTWAIDPLDGTFNFAHAVPYFCVSIGLLLNNKPVIGVINHVSDRKLFFAEKGKGAFLNENKIRVSRIKNLEESTVGVDFGHKKNRVFNTRRYAASLIATGGYTYALGSAALGLALVAQGLFDSYVASAWIWDFAAGAAIIEEAGGKVTDLEGNDPDWQSSRLALCSSNGLVHKQVLEAIK